MRAVLLAVVLAACGSDDPPGPAPRDAGVDAAPDAGRDAAPDASSAWACTCDGEEDCAACFDRLGTCCYDDPTLNGQVSRLVALCARTGSCSACCDECAAKSCEELVGSVLCPAADPPTQ